LLGAPQQISTGFASLPSLLQRRRSPEDNPTLHDIWPSPVLLACYTIYRELLPPDRILPGAKFTLRQSFAFSYMPTPSVTAWQSGSGRQPNCGVVQGMELSNFRRGRHLYSAGRSSRWSSVHILVMAALRSRHADIMFLPFGFFFFFSFLA